MRRYQRARESSIFGSFNIGNSLHEKYGFSFNSDEIDENDKQYPIFLYVDLSKPISIEMWVFTLSVLY